MMSFRLFKLYSTRQSSGERLDLRRSSRRLLIDVLEDRRLMAGLEPVVPDQPPTGITVNLVASIPENEATVLLGTIEVIDDDGGPNRIELSPAQAGVQVVGNEIYLNRAGGLNFEQSSQFGFTAKVFVGSNSVASVSEDYVLGVTDQNDPSLDINFVGTLFVEEAISGFEFGTLKVIDEDTWETFTFQVDDPRFEVVGDRLKLRADSTLSFSADPFVTIDVVATSTDSGQAIHRDLSIEVGRAAPPYQNSHWALDVNDDGAVTANDVLLVINMINRRGIGALDGTPPPGSPKFVDVNGDRTLSPIDALIIINYLNVASRSQNNPPSTPPIGEGERVVPTPQPAQMRIAAKSESSALSTSTSNFSDVDLVYSESDEVHYDAQALEELLESTLRSVSNKRLRVV